MVILTLIHARATPSPTPARSVGQTPTEGNYPPHINSTHQRIVNQILRWGEVHDYVLRSLRRVLEVVSIANNSGLKLPWDRALLSDSNRGVRSRKALIILKAVNTGCARKILDLRIVEV